MRLHWVFKNRLACIDTIKYIYDVKISTIKPRPILKLECGFLLYLLMSYLVSQSIINFAKSSRPPLNVLTLSRK